MITDVFYLAAMDRVMGDFRRHKSALHTIHPVYRTIFLQDITDNLFDKLERIFLIQMTAKGKRDTRTNFNGWKGFSNVPLTADAEKYFKLWVAEAHDWSMLYAEMQEHGYKFSGAYNAKNEAFSCSVTSTTEGRPDCGFTMTSLAPDPITAIQVAIFKHYVLCEEVWPLSEQSEGKRQWG